MNLAASIFLGLMMIYAIREKKERRQEGVDEAEPVEEAMEAEIKRGREAEWTKEIVKLFLNGPMNKRITLHHVQNMCYVIVICFCKFEVDAKLFVDCRVIINFVHKTTAYPCSRMYDEARPTSHVTRQYSDSSIKDSYS